MTFTSIDDFHLWTWLAEYPGTPSIAERVALWFFENPGTLTAAIAGPAVALSQ